MKNYEKESKYGVIVIDVDDERGPVDESDDWDAAAPSISVEDALFSWEAPRYLKTNTKLCTL